MYSNLVLFFFFLACLSGVIFFCSLHSLLHILYAIKSWKAWKQVEVPSEEVQTNVAIYMYIRALLGICVIGSTGRRPQCWTMAEDGELLVKEGLYIQMTPSEERFNQDRGLEVPDCWTAVIRRWGGGGAILTNL